MKLVDDWKKCLKWLSIQLCAIGILATSMWDLVPVLNSPKITILLFILIAVGRLIDQEKKDAGNP